MTWKQVTGNLDWNWTASPKNCLSHCGHVLNVPGTYGTSGWSESYATIAKNKCPNLHKDRDVPAGAMFMLYFDWNGYVDGLGTGNWGHVAIYHNGQIRTSPRNQKQFLFDQGKYGYETFNSISGLEKAFGCKYVGWSEYFSDKLIAEYHEEPKPIEPEPTEEGIKVGDIVVPLRKVDYYGTPLIQWDDSYVVTELVGDRAVLKADRKGELVTWAALNIRDINKI